MELLACRKHTFRSWQVGLLDVFGFESLETNSLEQLCINYANESMHALYLGHVFQGSELDDHLIESLLGEDAGRLDNRPCLALIEAPPNGVLHLLDHQCKARRHQRRGPSNHRPNPNPNPSPNLKP